MPVEGLPDPQRHAICRKCLQWFPKQDGDLIWPPVTGLMSFVHVRAAKMADAEKLRQFWCRGCQEKQAKKSAKAFRSALISIAILVTAILVLWYTGVLEQLLSTGPRR